MNRSLPKLEDENRLNIYVPSIIEFRIAENKQFELYIC